MVHCVVCVCVCVCVCACVSVCPPVFVSAWCLGGNKKHCLLCTQAERAVEGLANSFVFDDGSDDEESVEYTDVKLSSFSLANRFVSEFLPDY